MESSLLWCPSQPVVPLLITGGRVSLEVVITWHHVTHVNPLVLPPTALGVVFYHFGCWLEYKFDIKDTARVVPVHAVW